MEIVRRLDCKGSTLILLIKVAFDAEELDIIRRLGLTDLRIKTKDGPFVGRQHIPRNIKAAYRHQLARTKGRWGTALVRTTGYVLVDTLLALVGTLAWAVRSLIGVVLGRRKNLLAATDGIIVRSRRIERIREAELFILFSLAAIFKAIEYAREANEVTLSGSDLLFALDGLDFAGAGQIVESEFEAVQMVTDGLSKLHG